MQKINNLEAWETKAKQYNPRAGNGWLWAIAIALLLMAFVAPVYAEPVCWSEISCSRFSDATVSGSGTEEYCTINTIDASTSSTTGAIIIEIISGSKLGASYYHSFVVESQGLYEGYHYPFDIGDMITPIYILCSEYTTPTFGDYTTGKGQLIARWSSTDKDIKTQFSHANAITGTATVTNAGSQLLNIQNNSGQTFKIDNPTGQAFDIESSTDIEFDSDLNVNVSGSIDSNSNVTLGDINVAIENMTIPTDLNVTLAGTVDANLTGGFDLEMTDTNLTKSYTNLPANTTNPFILGLAWILFTLGLFLSITFIMQLFKRRE